MVLRFDPSDRGDLVIYAPPVAGANYTIGADVAEASSEGDYSCAQVLRHDNLEQVAVWHGRVPPRMFALELSNMGLFYNQAYIVCEFTGPGAVTCGLLYNDIGYPSLYWRERLDQMGGSVNVSRPGFVTSGRTKKIVLDRLASVLYEKDMVLHDRDTAQELLQFEHNYTRSGMAAYSAPPGKYDDRVMALALAVEGWRQFAPEDKTEDRVDWASLGASISTSTDVPDDDEEDTGEAMLRWCHK